MAAVGQPSAWHVVEAAEGLRVPTLRELELALGRRELAARGRRPPAHWLMRQYGISRAAAYRWLAGTAKKPSRSRPEVRRGMS